MSVYICYVILNTTHFGWWSGTLLVWSGLSLRLRRSRTIDSFCPWLTQTGKRCVQECRTKGSSELDDGWLQCQGTCLQVTWWPVKDLVCYCQVGIVQETQIWHLYRSTEPKVHLPAFCSHLTTKASDNSPRSLPASLWNGTCLTLYAECEGTSP